MPLLLCQCCCASAVVPVLLCIPYPCSAVVLTHTHTHHQNHFSTSLPYPTQAVGHAVAKCEPRSVIQQSGILAVLANLIPSVSVEDPPTPTTKQTSLLSCPLLGQAHVEFLQACIFAGNFAYAQQITGNTWPKPNATISVRNVLRYFYLRAVVHFECQQYQLAVRCLRTCLCVPADAVSVIALAAWKKLVLIQTLLQSHLANAKPMTLPQTTPSVFTRYIQNATNEEGNRPLPPPAGLVSKASSPDEHLVHMVINLETGEQVPKRGACDVYANLVRAFLQMNANNLHDMLQTHATILTQDGNLALAQRLATELPCRRLYDQSRVYSSIPMTELANLLEMPSTDELGQLLVKVSLQKAWPIQVTEDGMVRFPPLPPTGSSTNAAAATAELLDLTNLVQKLDANLSSSAKFMAVTRKESSSEGGGGGGEKGPSGPRGVEDI